MIFHTMLFLQKSQLSMGIRKEKKEAWICNSGYVMMPAMDHCIGAAFVIRQEVQLSVYELSGNL